jgi:hypothetical protein
LTLLSECLTYTAYHTHESMARRPCRRDFVRWIRFRKTIYFASFLSRSRAVAQGKNAFGLKTEALCSYHLADFRQCSLDLTAASRVYLLEPHWNPMIEEQALCRVHRVGQRRNVTTVRYLMRNSFEEVCVCARHTLSALGQFLDFTQYIGERHYADTSI